MTVTVVTGPPTGGKSTYIRQRAQAGDVVIDLDRIALAFATEGAAHHEYSRDVLTVAVAARRAAIDTALSLGERVAVWIIDTSPTATMLDRYREVGAEIVLCDPGEATVRERIARERPAHVKRIADRYYAGRLRSASTLRW